MKSIVLVLFVGACAHTVHPPTQWSSFTIPGEDAGLVETAAPPVAQPWKSIWQWKSDGVSVTTRRNIANGEGLNQPMALELASGAAWQVTIWTGTGFLPDSLWVLHVNQSDVDRDGKAEVLIRYRISGEERPAVGAAVEERLAIHALDTGKQQLDLRVATHQSDKRCEVTIHTGDVNDDGHPDLQVHSPCDDAAKNNQTLWQYQPTTDRWTAVR